MAFVRIACEQLQTAASVAAETAPGVEVAQQVIISCPLPVLIAESKRARLVVIGDRGLGGVTGLLVGSVAVGLAARGGCPVVMRGEPMAADRVVTRNAPANRLLAQAQQAQLVVVGSHGRGGFAGLVLGSVSHSLLYHAPCPVAVVRVDPECV